MQGLDILRFARGFTPTRRKTRISNTNGRRWKFKPRHAYKDYDGDGKVNRYDCKPLNPYKQDLRIIPSINKDSTANKIRKSEDINISHKGMWTDKELEKHMPSVISHEELHKAVEDVAGWKASAQLDNISKISRSEDKFGLGKADEIMSARDVLIETYGGKKGTDLSKHPLTKKAIERELEEQAMMGKVYEKVETQKDDDIDRVLKEYDVLTTAYNKAAKWIMKNVKNEKEKKKLLKGLMEEAMMAQGRPLDETTHAIEKRKRGRPRMTKEEMLRKGLSWEDIERREAERLEREKRLAERIGKGKKRMRASPEEAYEKELQNTIDLIKLAEKEENKVLKNLLKRRLEKLKKVQPHEYKEQ